MKNAALKGSLPIKKLILTSVALLLAAPLTGCAVSAAETNACKETNGLIITRPFKMHAKEPTRAFTFCEVNGKITKVFDDDKTAIPKALAATCEKDKGKVYAREMKSEQKKKNDKGEEVVVVTNLSQSFICVAAGEVTASFYQEQKLPK